MRAGKAAAARLGHWAAANWPPHGRRLAARCLFPMFICLLTNPVFPERAAKMKS